MDYKIEISKADFNLHIEAGLIATEMNDEGEIDWIGTKYQWAKYEKLSKEIAN